MALKLYSCVYVINLVITTIPFTFANRTYIVRLVRRSHDARLLAHLLSQCSLFFVAYCVHVMNEDIA